MTDRAARSIAARALATVATAGLAAAGVRLLARRTRQRAGGAVASTGRLERSLDVARLTSRVSTGYLTGSAREVFASAGRRQELRAERQLRTTADVVATLGSMKGALMKLGQMASYLDAGMPDHMREALATLQSDAPPMTAELAESVLEAELGAGASALFSEWDPIPVAAASIGQVHRAITLDGRPVAVKIQYPGVDRAITADLDNSALLLQLLRAAFPSLDAAPLVAELRDRIGEELDYRCEARNQAFFARIFADHPFIHVPAVVPELSTQRVLTSDLVVGSRYDEVLTWPQDERDLAGETIFRFVFGCLYRLQVFNGDPHPGNYLFHGGGRVTFLDYGLVKWFDGEDVELLASMVRSLVTMDDPAGFRLAAERAGFLRPDSDFPDQPGLTDVQVGEYFRHYYQLVLTDGPQRFSPDYAAETLRHFFAAGDPVIKRANVPPSFAILQRINLGLYAVLAGLGATGDWRRIANEIWPWVNAPPSTALGALAATWTPPDVPRPRS